jgi:hypothetical protein
VKQWCIPSADGAFVAAMEDVLDLYERPYKPQEPVVCFDESNKQLIEETRLGTPPAPGCVAKQDYQYKRNGTRNLFLFFEPLASWRHIQPTLRRTKEDFAHCMRWLSEVVYPDAECIHVVLDNLNTHSAASLYETFKPEDARYILKRLRFHHTPKHGSWLNMAEIEFSVLFRLALNERIGDMPQLCRAIGLYEAHRNKKRATVNWQFTTADARIKLRRLYPSISG